MDRYELKFRQVHLDFHTNGTLPVGKKFSKEQFQAALKAGHVDSITVFSKCHHGWSYHPTKANQMHPALSFDLLGAQIEAAHEIDVRTPVYISAGFDEKYAHDQLILVSRQWSSDVNNGDTFIADKWASVHTDIRNPENWSFYTGSTVLKEHVLPQ